MKERIIQLIGEENFEKLNKSNVIVFGLGGVGGSAALSLVRSGLGNISVVDMDIFEESNLNRQLLSDLNSVGKLKTLVFKEKALLINPKCKIETFNIFYNKETYDEINLDNYDYIIDCIDNVTAKIHLAEYAYNNNINIISSMGTGKLLDPSKLEITDLFKTSYDKIAKVMRKELKKSNVRSLKVVCSTEIPISTTSSIIPSMVFVPNVCGLMLSSYVVKNLIL